MSQNFFSGKRDLIYPTQLGENEDMPAYVQFKFFERKNMKSSALIQTISLPMPTGLKKPSTVSYDNVGLGMVVGSAVSDMRQQGGNMSLNVAGQGAKSSTYGTAVDHLYYQMGALGTTILRSPVNKDQLMALSENKVFNPYYTMIFKGVNLGQYEFEFIFTPNNAKEAQTIKDIIQSFRMHHLPYQDKLGEHYLGYPNEVEVSFWWKDDVNPFIRKFKRSNIDFLDTDDAPLGTTTLARDGVNLQQILRLKLTELEIVTREDVQGGY